MINQSERSVEHRWFELTLKRGEGQTVVPSRFVVDSIHGYDHNTLSILLNVSRKFVPIGSRGYLAPSENDDSMIADGTPPNKWGRKFKDVDKLMAFLCYEMNIHKNKDGTTR